MISYWTDYFNSLLLAVKSGHHQLTWRLFSSQNLSPFASLVFLLLGYPLSLWPFPQSLWLPSFRCLVWPEFFPHLPSSLISLLSSTQVISHCLMCSTSQALEKSFILGFSISSLFSEHPINYPPSTSHLVHWCPLSKSAPFLLLFPSWVNEGISFRLPSVVDIQIRSGSE